MPTFCRHNRFEQNCPICSKQTPGAFGRESGGSTAARPKGSGSGSSRRRSGSPTGVRVKRDERLADDGYRTGLAPGLRSSGDAERLAEEIAASVGRLAVLASEPPGLYGEVASEPDAEEAHWLAFLIAYLSPLDGEDPWAGISAARVPWASGEPPHLQDVPLGPRTAHDPARGTKTIDAYRAWVQRGGSQAAAFAGDERWTPERRFDRVFERLALPGLHGAARFDLLVTLGRLGIHEMSAASLHLGGTNDDTVIAAKRAFGIGDPRLLDQRATELAGACGVPLQSFDLALRNWGTGHRTMAGVPEAEPDPGTLQACRAALGL